MQASAHKEKAPKIRKEQRETAQRDRERKAAAKEALARGESASAMSGPQRRQQEAALAWIAHLSRADGCVEGKEPQEAVQRWTKWALDGTVLAHEVERANGGKAAADTRKQLWAAPLQGLSARWMGSDHHEMKRQGGWEWAMAPLRVFANLAAAEKERQGEIGAQSIRRLVQSMRSPEATILVAQIMGQGIESATPEQFKNGMELWSALKKESLVHFSKGQGGADYSQAFDAVALNWSAAARQAGAEKSREILTGTSSRALSASMAQITPGQIQSIKERARAVAQEWLALGDQCLGMADPRNAEDAAAFFLSAAIDETRSLNDENRGEGELGNLFSLTREKWREKALSKIKPFGAAGATAFFALLGERGDAQRMLFEGQGSERGSQMALGLARLVDWGQQRNLNSKAYRSAIDLLGGDYLTTYQTYQRQRDESIQRANRRGLMDAMIESGAAIWKENALINKLDQLGEGCAELASALRARVEGVKITKVIASVSAQQRAEDDRATGELGEKQPRAPAPRQNNRL